MGGGGESMFGITLLACAAVEPVKLEPQQRGLAAD